MNLKQELETLKKKIAELEKELEKVGNESEKKYPADGTMVYFLDSYGDVLYQTWGYWADEETQKRAKLMFDSGERFLTEEAAEEYAEVKQIERELFALADDNKEWNGVNAHYTVGYTSRNEIDSLCFQTSRMNIPYFASDVSAMVSVRKVGEERVIKWLTYKRKRPQI